MKTITKILFLLLALPLVVAPAMAQTTTPRTTLTNAITVTGGGNQNITVGSTTGMTASGTGTGAVSQTGGQTYVLIDGELMPIRTVVSSTVLTVGHGGLISQHAAGTDVRYVVGGQWQPSSGNTSGTILGASSSPPTGACTRANMTFLPVFQVNLGIVMAYDCPNNISTTTGTWIQWQYWPKGSSVAARTPLPFAGTAVAKTYTALVSDYYIAVTTAFGTAQTQITITLPCASVPAGKIWIVGDEGGGAGSSSSNIEIVGAFLDSQAISAGYTAKAYRSNGTSCFRLW